MKGFEAYQDAAVTTQSKGRLVVMLYDGAIKFLTLAIRELEAGNFEAKGKYIGKAQDVIIELNAVLDMEAGGEIATNLRKLYLYMNKMLNEANSQKDTGRIQEVITLLRELNESWKAVSD